MTELTDDALTTRYVQRLIDGDYRNPTIAGCKATFHAVARMLTRKIHADWVVEAIQRSSQIVSPEKSLQYRGPRATAFVDSLSNELITVTYGYQNDPRRKWFGGREIDQQPEPNIEVEATRLFGIPA